jgi:hypothetical protein
MKLLKKHTYMADFLYFGALFHYFCISIKIEKSKIKKIKKNKKYVSISKKICATIPSIYTSRWYIICVFSAFFVGFIWRLGFGLVVIIL